MASNISDTRKYIQQCGTGSNDPKYVKPISTDDLVAIPFVEIKIWECTSPDWFSEPKTYLRLTEVESVEISKTYKKIFQTATFTIPRGTIISARMQKLGDSKVKTGEGTDNENETKLKAATQGGDVIVQGSYFDTETGESLLPVNASRSDDGVLKITHETTDRFVSSSDIAPGKRVEIRMKYAYNDDDYQKYKKGEAGYQGDLVFSGIVHKCSVNSPLVVQCEDLMSIMKKLPCPNLVAKKNYSVNDFLADDGAFKLIARSGIKLDPDSKNANISVGKVGLTRQNVVADILDEWSKCGLYAFINESANPPTLRVGRVYTSKYNDAGKTTGNLVALDGGINVIQFDWDVANDGLKVDHIDSNFLAVEAHAQNNEGKYWKLTVRPNPDDQTKQETPYLVNNIRIPKTKAQMKKKADGTANLAGTSSDPPPTLGLDTYTIVPYFASKIGITQEELAKEAWEYHQRYKMNGISGSLTLFGDRSIRPTESVALIDPRHPERNGYYFVEEVNTKFSVTEGYRVEIKLPYKLGTFKNNIKII